MIDFMKLQNGSNVCGVASEGIPGEDVVLTEEVAGAIAGAYAYWLGFKAGKNPYDLRICVGNDSRRSADTLRSGLLKGIAMFGAEGYDAGLATAPAMFMSTVLPQLDYDGAIMITAGHLPWNMNGFRFFTKEGEIGKDDTASILRTASRYNFVGEYYEERSENVLPVYAAYLRQMISLGLADLPGGLAGMHIVVDAGNGAGGFFATQVLEPMGADISGSQFLEPDGMFPYHSADPCSREAIASISRAVVENGADLGIIFDSDAGRSVLIGPDGKAVSGNSVIALAAALAADDYPGGTVVTDSVTSAELGDFLENRLKLRHLRYKRCFRDVISKAVEINSSVAGDDPGRVFLAADTSGHTAFADNFFFDDGTFLATQVIINAAHLKREGKSIMSLIESLEAPAESRKLRFALADENPGELAAGILEDMEKWVRESSGLELEIPNYEGVRVRFRLPAKDGGQDASGWFLLRKSMHDAEMTFSVESDTEDASDAVLEMINKFMGQYKGVSIPE